MARVLLYTYQKDASEIAERTLEFERIPVVGEYVILGENSEWYKVEMVLHCPFTESPIHAEVWAVKADHSEESKKNTSIRREPAKLTIGENIFYK